MAIHPKSNLSKAVTQQLKYPYLLCDIAIDRCNQARITDLTYVCLNQGFVHLMAIIDWYNRYVLDWELIISYESV